MVTIFIIIIEFILVVLGGVLVILFLKKQGKGKILGSLNMALFSVVMPKYEAKGKEMEEKELIGQMEQIYTNFLSLKKPGGFKSFFMPSPRIVFEVASQTGGSDISFYVGVPGYLKGAFEKYVQGVYPSAEVKQVPQDYTVFEPGGTVAAAYGKLKVSPFFPLSTYKNLEKDPLAALTNALTKIKPEEGAAIQIIIKPLTRSDWKKSGDKVLQAIREGKSVKVAMKEAMRSPVQEFIAEISNALLVLLGGSQKKKEESLIKETQVQIEESTVKAIEAKVRKEIFQTNIRLIAIAQTQSRAEEILTHMESAFGQFSLSAFNGFDIVQVKGRRLKKLIYDFSFRVFDKKQQNILNIEELTSIYHFPTHYIETPYVKTAKTGTTAPPLELPEKGVMRIGKVEFRGEEKEVYFATQDDRRRHFYIVGQTGTGKTTLLQEMIRQDIEQGAGVGVIDPHGELIEAILANIPKKRVEDVVLFEPFDMERPIGLNMLEYETPEQKDFAVQEMITIFYKLFPPEIIGPMFEHYMRNAMLVLMADKENPGTLVDIPRLFTDEKFMEQKLRKVTDPMVRNFWLKEWKQTTGSTRSDMLGYVVSKLGRFIENEMMRNIIGQSHSTINLEKIMNEEKILLVNLSKGLTGELNSSLLGLLLVSKIQMAAMKRARVSEEERKDFYLYIDEFQNFTTDSIATILSEARKYRLNLTLAHQYMPQLTSEIRNAVLGNVGTIASFRIGADDAEFLEKQFEPEFSRTDLVNLDNFTFVIKMLIEGKISSPFKMQTIPAKNGDKKIVPVIKKITKLKYGKRKETVEMEIMKRSQLS